MKYKPYISPPGTLPIFPPGSSAGDRDGTGPRVEDYFHGKPEPPPHRVTPDKWSYGQLQARGDPHLTGSSAGDRGGTGPPVEDYFHGKPEPPPHRVTPDKWSYGQLQARGDPHLTGSSAGDRGGTGPPVEDHFHGKPEPPPPWAIPDKEREGRLQTRGDPPGIDAGVILVPYRQALPGAPPGWRANALKRRDRKRTVDYEHRPLSPPGGGWREPAQGPPLRLNCPAPPGIPKSPRRGPPGATEDKFNSLSAERNPGPRLGAPPGTAGMKLAEIQTTNQGR